MDNLARFYQRNLPRFAQATATLFIDPPLGRVGRPEEVAHITLALCLPSASFVNGTAIPVDGGMSIRHT